MYEEIGAESPKSKRYKLVNPHCFSGVYDGAGNIKLWDEVYAYLDSHYDLEKVRKIYLNVDGGTWIQSGKKGLQGFLEDHRATESLRRNRIHRKVD